jgi:hypothetical protein
MSSNSSRHMLPNSRNISCRRSRNKSRRSDLEASASDGCGKRGLFGRIFGLDGRESYRELRLEPLYWPTV